MKKRTSLIRKQNALAEGKKKMFPTQTMVRVYCILAGERVWANASGDRNAKTRPDPRCTKCGNWHSTGRSE